MVNGIAGIFAFVSGGTFFQCSGSSNIRKTSRQPVVSLRAIQGQRVELASTLLIELKRVASSSRTLWCHSGMIGSERAIRWTIGTIVPVREREREWPRCDATDVLLAHARQTDRLAGSLEVPQSDWRRCVVCVSLSGGYLPSGSCPAFSSILAGPGPLIS